MSGRVLLIPGAGQSHSVWDRVRPRLAERFAVSTVPRRGGGDFRTEAVALAASVAQVGEPVTLVGHSGGAVVALEAALACDLVRALALYEPPVLAGVPPYRPDALLATMTRLIAGGRAGDAVVAFHRHTGADRLSLDRMRGSPRWPAQVAGAGGLLAALRASAGYRPPDAALRDLKIPVLLLLGEHSGEVYPASVAHLAGLLPHTRTVILGGQRHDALVRAPQDFLAAVMPFLLLTVD